MTPQTSPVRQAITDLHAALHEAGVTAVELKADYEGDLYLSVPTEYHEAVEIEAYYVPHTRDKSETVFTLTRRAWDRTGGMSAELEVGETNQPHLMVAMIQADLTYLAKEASRLATQMEGEE